MLAAESAWPARGRSACTLGTNAAREAWSASIESAHATSAATRDPPGAHRAECGEGAHELGAVDQGEPLLGSQDERLEPDACERLSAGDQLAVDPCLALADEWQRQVRQRGEIAARPHRATARNVRQHPGAEQGEQELGDLDTHSRVALGQRVRAHDDRGSDDLVRVGLPHSAGMAAQQPELELLHELLRDCSGSRTGRSRCSRRTSSRALRQLAPRPPARLASSRAPNRRAPRPRRRRRSPTRLPGSGPPRSVEPRSCGPSVESSPDRSRARAGEAREHATRRTRRCATPTRPPRRRRRRA